ncbi:MAG: hypothetical protein HY209_03750 [Candidatus Omnitrophica bacterium]|nr:hypothetical protein [Candidatus Omnitrophota bacterium]
MKTNIIIIAALIGLLLGFVLVSGGRYCCRLNQNRPAQAYIPVAQADAQASQSVEVGNTICPISGNSIYAMGGPLKYEYKGKIYNLCCGGCIRRFESDPERYSKIAEDEAKGQAQ